MYIKGEWKVEQTKFGDWLVVSSETQFLKHTAIADISKNNDNAEANANLIALSPRMLELLRRMVEDGWNTAIAIDAKEIVQTLDL
uniref:Uncharacterized protein n=1 Tax=viral metagenome TaxID=1070528 RepID=A0A6M3JIJ8_9ZZZZ